MVSVLVVDDEPRIVGLVREYLDRAGFAVLEAADGTQALDLFAEHQPDAVVLDLGLPDMDGVDLLRRLRADSSVPILVLTARADELDRVLGLELGADDYVVKPFGPRELVARIRALLRRPSLGDHLDGDVVVVGDLRIDVPKRQVSVAGAEVALTPTEFDLLETLARQPGRVFLCFQTAGVWEIGTTGSMALPNHIDRAWTSAAEPEGQIRAVVAPGEGGAFTATVVDASGEVLTHLEGYRTIGLPVPLEDGLIGPLSAAMAGER